MPPRFCRFGRPFASAFPPWAQRMHPRGRATPAFSGKALPLSADRGLGQVVLDVMLRALGLLAQRGRQQIAQALSGVLQQSLAD